MKKPSERAPKKLYWVDLETIGKLNFRQKGGGKFTMLEYAQARQEYLASQGIKSTVYEGEVVWKEVLTPS